MPSIPKHWLPSLSVARLQDMLMGIQQATLEHAILDMPQLAPAIALLKVGTNLGAMDGNTLHTL